MNSIPSTYKSEFVTTKELARIFSISHRTLEQWRWQGKGPPFHKVGRMIRYRIDEAMSFFN